MQHALNVSLGMEFSSTEYSDTRNAYTLNSGHGPGTLLALNVGVSSNIGHSVYCMLEAAALCKVRKQDSLFITELLQL